MDSNIGGKTGYIASQNCDANLEALRCNHNLGSNSKTLPRLATFRRSLVCWSLLYVSDSSSLGCLRFFLIRSATLKSRAFVVSPIIL